MPLPARHMQLTRFCREVRQGKRTLRDAVETAAMLGAANERDRTFRLLERHLPGKLADRAKAAVMVLGIKQVVGVEAAEGE